MKEKNHHSLFQRLFASLFAVLAIFSSVLNFTPTFAIDDNSESTSQNTSQTADQPQKTENQNSENQEDTEGVCAKESGALGWGICPGTGAIAKAIDGIYSVIEGFLTIEPLSDSNTSTIHLVWEYARNLTNIIFIIFLLIVVYSQLTGLGINNYGIKRVLPRIIIAALLVNLSFVICQIAVDVSNILGFSLRGFFTSIQETAIQNGAAPAQTITWTQLVDAITGGTLIASLGITFFVGGITAAFWALLPIIIGALVAIGIGLITISMRQALVTLLIMISPLAFVCFLLPNTEKWFEKWKDLLIKMLVFYPIFSVLFGASQLAGWAIINSANGEAFGIILGLAVQVFPLFFSWSLMKMSGTILGTISQKLSNVANKPLSALGNYSQARNAQSRQNFFLNSRSIGASSRRFFDYRTSLRNAHTLNQKSIYDNNIAQKVQKRLAGGDIDDKEENYKTDKYVRAAKKAKNTTLAAANAAAHTEHILANYDTYHKRTAADHLLNTAGQNVYLDSARATYIKEIDDENGVQFLTDKFLAANKRDANGNPIDAIAFERYNRSIAGADGEQRVLAKVITQASKTESKQRAEYAILHAKYGHNGYNKGEFRSWLAGYRINDDGWAIDEHGNRLRNADGSYVETIRGEIKNKAPERMVLYDKRDNYGLYYDMKDQDGNVVARIHRGTGADGLNHDDAAFIKETLANTDIPIGDPINDVYSILAGTKAGDIQTPQGPNEIGLARYSTTIGRALANYKGNAAWAGAMFNSMVGNRQIHNSAQMAIAICDSIIKTAKPGALNTQNPASIQQLMTILDPKNWDKIFREEDIMDGVNINNKPWGGENWVPDDNGNLDINNLTDDNIQKVDNPTYEQRMNTIKRKFLFPALEKITPAILRNSTPNTIDNQKPGAGDAWSNFIDMIKEQWEENPDLPDPNLKKYDLLGKTREFKAKQRDKDGNPIYNTPRSNSNRSHTHRGQNPYNFAREAYERATDADSFFTSVFNFLYEEDYDIAMEVFSNWRDENPNATIEEIWEFIDNDLRSFFTE